MKLGRRVWIIEKDLFWYGIIKRRYTQMIHVLAEVERSIRNVVVDMVCSIVVVSENEI